jgi:uracil-DNA glycosylase family 4
MLICTMLDNQETRRILEWHLAAGVDETIAQTPVDRFADLPEPICVTEPAVSVPTAQSDHAVEALQMTGDQSVRSAVEQAAAAKSLEALRAVLEAFDGCALKKTATHLVFTDGDTRASLMFIGEAPGAEEDRRGLPFVGPSGQLLDRMLASIGIDRAEALISNTVFWRPPGNRTPTPQETAICLPFVERMIELVNPDVVVALGGPAAKSLLGETQGVGRLRGRWFSYQSAALSHPIDATAMYHPAYLLKTPAQKRVAWQDLQMIKRRLAGHTKN